MAIIALLALATLAYVGYTYYKPAPSEVPVSINTFACDQGKTIGAVFYTNKVALTLSDGRKMTLPQAISASGARYANNDESFVFWNKGNTAFINEGKTEPQAQTYTNCVTPDNEQATPNMQSYSYPPLGFSIKYPAGYALDESYMYQGLGEEGIPGVKVSVSSKNTDGTNLSGDTGVSVEYIPNADSCSASLFLYGSPKASAVTDGGVSYSVASITDAGAGNLYEEKVYAIKDANPCIAVRYFIHYSQIANYPAGTKKEFDKQALLKEFDTIRRSLTLKAQTEAQ